MPRNGFKIGRCLALALAASLFGAPTARAAPVEEITMLTWGGAFLDAFKIAADAFEKQTGIKVVFVTQVGATDGLNKLIAQKDAPQVDVWGAIESTAQTATELGLLQTIDTSKIPNLKDVPSEYVKPTSIALWLSPRGIFYRKDLVPFEIKSWKDLWDPRLKGMVGTSMNLDTGNFLIMAALLNGGSETNIDPGFEMIEKLKPNVGAVYTEEVQLIKLMQTGEIPICSWCTFANANRMLGPDSKYVFVMPEGPHFLPTTPVTIVAGRSPEQIEASHKFVNVLMDPEIQGKMVQIIGNVPANRKATRPESAQRYLPGIIGAPYQIDWIPVMKNYQGWATRWTRTLQ